MQSQQLTAQKSLILGCGHSQLFFNGCGLPHPAKDFITVDHDPARMPDVVADIEDFESFQKKLGRRFIYVIFEHFPLSGESFISKFKPLLDDNGYIILIGSGFDRLDQLEIGHKLWFCQGLNASFSRTAIIIPANPDHPDTNPILDHAASRYLTSYLGAGNQATLSAMLKPSIISETFKRTMPALRDQSRNFFNTYTQQVAWLLNDTVNTLPTKTDIMAMINTYTPGYVRKFFSGKTADMYALERLMNSKKEHLSAKDLHEIANVVSLRHDNSIRQSTSETTRVFSDIYARINTYFLTKIPSPTPPRTALSQ